MTIEISKWLVAVKREAKKMVFPDNYCWCHDMNAIMRDFLQNKTTLFTNLPPGWTTDMNYYDKGNNHTIAEINLYHQGYLIAQYYPDAYYLLDGYQLPRGPKMILNQ